MLIRSTAGAPGAAARRWRVRSSFPLLLLFGVITSPVSAQDAAYRAARFTSVDGSVLSGRLYLPDTGARLPGVVLVHGSGPDDAASYEAYARAFIRAGIAVLTYDKRGSGASGGDWRHRPFVLLAADARAAIRALQREHRVDSAAVGLWGVSQGTWVIAEAAQAEPQPAFVIAVAPSGVAPEQQELWHKDNLMRALGYSEKARLVGLTFWQLAFDFIERMDAGEVPLPRSVLEGERAGASTGLRYDALPAWQRVHVPVLLLGGTRDELSPGDEARRLITQALGSGGNAAVRSVLFADASHTITTRNVGLHFDWDTHFHPGYFPTMTAWIGAVQARRPTDTSTRRGSLPRPGVSWQPGGRWGHARWWGATWPQLACLVLLPLALLALLVVEMRGARARSGDAGREPAGTSVAWGATAVGGLALLGGFWVFVVQSLFAQGMAPLELPYRIPAWQRMLPVAGNAVVAAAAAAMLSSARDAVRLRLTGGRVVTCVVGGVLIAWCLHWRLVGLPL